MGDRTPAHADPWKRQRLCLWLGLSLLAVLATTLVVLRTGDPLEPDPVGVHSSPRTPEFAPVGGAQELVASAAGSEVRRIDGLLTTPRQELDATQREPVAVLVVEQATGKPVAGAEFRWANLSEIGRRADPTRPRSRADPFVLPDDARRTTSDERGLAHVDARLDAIDLRGRVPGSGPG